MLYNTLLVAHINYCLMTWGSQCQRINQLQKRAIRITTLSNFNSHTDPLFKKLNLLKVNDMLALQELNFYYKFIHNKLSTYLQHWQIATNSKIHGHNTRNQNKIHIYGTKHTFTKQCLKYSLPNTINNTFQSVKDKLYTHSLQGFIYYAKYHIIQNYKNTCTVINCYTCTYMPNQLQ